MKHLQGKKLILALVLSTIFQFWLSAQEKSDSLIIHTISTTLDIFEDPRPMEITLTLDLKTYQREKFEGEYIPVHFLYEFGDSVRIEKSMRIKARGKFRREYCTFAPFWLNIRKANVTNEHLQDVKKMKVVTQCKGGKAYSEYVLKEYLAYKIYNMLSPVSFRVRLIHMTYIDTGRKNKVTENWAFLIEPEEMLAERNGGIAIKKDELSMHFMRTEQMDVAALFLYMIGNSDYSIVGRHNMKILGLPDYGSKGYTPVPYDFDYSGIVNSHYAVPGENLGISSVRQRYYLGPCREDQEFQKAIDHIQSHRDEILELVEDFPYLAPKHKKEMIRYLEAYFDSASRPGFIRSGLQTSCR
ncbi:MAG: hypothetical protein ABFS28_00770 [Bacteroidota bacterium]